MELGSKRSEVRYHHRSPQGQLRPPFQHTIHYLRYCRYHAHNIPHRARNVRQIVHLHLTSLSASTGKEIASTHVSSAVSHGLKDVIALRHSNHSNTNSIVAWLQQGTLRTFKLTPDLKGKPTSVKGWPSYKSFKDIGLKDHGQFIAIKLDESSWAYKLTKDNSGLVPFWDFADSARRRNIWDHFMVVVSIPAVGRISRASIGRPRHLSVLDFLIST
jgi:hypothetical protein